MPGRRKEIDMEISIEYCGTCNYRPIAASLAFAIEKETGIKSVLVHSKEMGALEVKVGSELIFSKKQTGRFPDASKLVELLKIPK
jgi:selT/selW/selH-like putative selenoprotein